MKRIIITVEQGLVTVAQKPRGVAVIVIDRDPIKCGDPFGYAEYKTEESTEAELHACDNCESVFEHCDLKEIADYADRVTPGGTAPSGECPLCGALCYPAKEE